MISIATMGKFQGAESTLNGGGDSAVARERIKPKVIISKVKYGDKSYKYKEIVVNNIKEFGNVTIKH